MSVTTVPCMNGNKFRWMEHAADRMRAVTGKVGRIGTVSD